MCNVFGSKCKEKSLSESGLDPGLAKGEMDHGEHKPVVGVGSRAEPPAGSLVGVSAAEGKSPPEVESLLSIFIQKRGQKLMISVIACPCV